MGKFFVHLEIFWFEYSGRFIVLPIQKTALLSYGYASTPRQFEVKKTFEVFQTEFESKCA